MFIFQAMSLTFWSCHHALHLMKWNRSKTTTVAVILTLIQCLPGIGFSFRHLSARVITTTDLLKTVASMLMVCVRLC